MVAPNKPDKNDCLVPYKTGFKTCDSAVGYTFFLLTRINPSDVDIETFLEGCREVNAKFYGYDIIRWKMVHSLRGFIAIDNGCHVDNIERKFPNFLLKTVKMKRDD